MLNHQLKNAGYYEWLRRKAEEYTGQPTTEPPKTVYAVGSMEWQAEQQDKRKAEIEAAAVK